MNAWIMGRLRWGLLGLSVALAGPRLLLADDADEAPQLPPAAGRTVDFVRDIKPIFARNCVRCHGPKKQQGGLALHLKERALAGGDSGPAVVPGKSAESRLVRYVAGLDEDYVMPPEGAADPLSPEQIALLRAWIDQGAAWPDEDKKESATGAVASEHWSFRKPVRPPLPAVKNPAWPRNEIDRFVLARLEKEGLAPAPEADRATLIRRLSLDLTGLPPTVAEADAFLADTSPDAYEKLVDRLLASPHYGERWGRWWLDRARYADTNGYEKDRERSIWPYRDWVIRALNDDMPFDQFTVEQLAGDLLPNASTAQRVATGFHRNTMINEEGGIDVEEFRYAALVDRVATTGTVWLGLTIQCAQCHTHKYDPITQREYYQFLAFFNNADEPDLELPRPDIAARRAAIEAEIADLEADLEDQFPAEGAGPASATPEQRREHLDRKMAEWERSFRPVRWTVLTPSRLVSQKHATLTVQPDQSVLATGDKPNNDTYEVELPAGLKGITALRLEVLPDPSLPDGGPGRAPLFSVGDFLLSGFEVTEVRGDEKPRPVKLAHASEDYSEPGRPAALAIDGASDTGWTVKGGTGKPHAAVFELGEDVGGPGARLLLTLRQEGIHQMTIGRFRVSATTDPRPVRASGLPAEIEAVRLIPPDARTAGQAEQIRRYYLSVAPELKPQNERIEALRRSLPKFPTTMVLQERDPAHARVTHVHKRGEFLKTPEPVEPGVPAVLPPLPAGAPRNRLTLARWLVAPENPLVGRVIMNQLWQAYFDRGLVTTPEDFGAQGARPTHPELLDWLATELPRRGWSLKALHRLIVTSASYRQSSRATPGLLARDPKNELLARGPRFRVEAEVIRDIALTASGLLNREVGGPSVYPPQPDGVTALAKGQAGWPTSTGPARYRRGLYTFLKRTAPYAAFSTFDAPTSETVCVRRERSDTPLQALTLLNDAVFVEAARALARRVVTEAPGGTEERIRLAFRLCLTRPPRADEVELLRAYYERQLGRLRSGELQALLLLGADAPPPPPGADANELAAWMTLARALLNLDETVTRE